MSGHITTFLRAREVDIEMWSLTLDELVVQLKPTLDLRTAMAWFADLIVYVDPMGATVNVKTPPYEITLSLRSH